MSLSAWQGADGAAPIPGDIAAEPEEFSPPDACDALEPDEEHFHEATGNEGASFERTYRRAALVLWPGDRLFAVLSQAGLPVTLPYPEELVRRWAESAEDRWSALRREAHDLAGHMIARWPRQGWYPREDKGPSDAARMLNLLTRLDDAAAIENFLTEVVAAGCHGQADNQAILGALGHLSPPRDAAMIERIIAGTAATAFAAGADLLARAAAVRPRDRVASLASAATRLLDALPGDPARATPREPWARGAGVTSGAVADLLTGLGAIDAVLAGRGTDHILAWPKIYRLDSVLIPALRKLIGAGIMEGLPAVERLRAACLAHLRARTAEPLAPPADWSRANTLPCHCRHCTELARFLADPERKTWTLKAAEPDRRHVEGSMRQAHCDPDTTTDRRGRPYSLVCTKNQASYERRVRQRRKDPQDSALLAV